MSSENKFLALRLMGPLQSWGFDSQYSRRNTGLFPTKSAVAGICCAALGLARGCAEEPPFLAQFAALKMTAIAIPRVVQRQFARSATEITLRVRRLQDYHTVQNTITAEGKTKPCHITHRQYLTDASFGVLIEGNAALLERVADALSDPKWGIWLGRKTCIPSAPVLAGLCDSQDEALKLLIGDSPLENFTRQEEAASFAEGHDTLPDQPVSFASDRRAGGCPHAPRRVITYQGLPLP